MKHLRSYNQHLKLSKKTVKNNLILVEKKLMNDFSDNFYTLCLNSSLFSLNEKNFITENFSTQKIDLIAEEWQWLDNLVKKGSDIVKKIKDKVKTIRDNISAFIQSMISFAKKFLTGFFDAAIKVSKKIFEKNKDKLNKDLENLDPVKKKEELEQLKETHDFFSNKFKVKIVEIVENAKSEAESSLDKNLDILDSESQNEESIFLDFKNEDILQHLYEMKITEASANTDKPKGVTGWLLEFLGQSELDPEAKTGKKLLWWGKLFLKVLSTCLSPFVKIIEFTIKLGGNKILEGLSMLSKKLAGPGVYKFVLLGGIVAGILGLITESMLLAHIHFPGDKFLETVIIWIQKTIENFGEFCDWIKPIGFICTGFCALMTLWHVTEEFSHLAHSAK